MGITEHVTAMKGIGEKKAQSLKKINIEQIEDFLYFFPRDYQDRRNVVKITDLIPGKAFLIKAVVDQSSKNIKFKPSFYQILTIGEENDTYEEIYVDMNLFNIW
jgi:ATP-dependent DNA helicase RecG